MRTLLEANGHGLLARHPEPPVLPEPLTMARTPRVAGHQGIHLGSEAVVFWPSGSQVTMKMSSTALLLARGAWEQVAVLPRLATRRRRPPLDS